MAKHLVNKYFCLLILLNLGLFSSSSFASDENFPVPDNIRPAIAFWIKVYTEADTQSGFLHDSTRLSVIYDKLPRDSSIINSRRESIQADLRVLASGKRQGLSPSQQRILALWPEDVSNEELAAAVNTVRWQLGQSDRFIAGLQRSGAYRTHINNVISSKDMPLELGVLPHVESSFHPGAYSSAAASGMWQFIRATAERFMRVDNVVDDRLDPYNATHGAMALLEYNYSVLGSWPLALTAYNHGTNGMARAVRAMGTRDIGQIIAEYKGPRFGFASRNFYPQFLAALEVDARAHEFFGPVEMHTHPGFYEQRLDSYVDARVLAQSLGVSTADLRRDNPALQSSVWSGSKLVPRGYTVKVRRDNSSSLNMLASLQSIPLNQLFSQQIPDLSYTVRSGDSLSVIAERHRTTISELVAINQLRDRNTIRIGQTLLLPQPDGTVPSLLVSSNASREIPANGEYEVMRGDSISVIAEHFRVSEAELLAYNAMTNADLIYPGQTLRLRAAPGQEPTPAIQTAAATVLVAENQNTRSAFTDSGEEPVLAAENPNALAEEPSPVELAMEAEAQLLADLATDPSDYSVALDDTIEIQAVETLGHYADWLGIRAQDLRRINRMSMADPVMIGRRLKLDFSQVDRNTFESRRQAFHRDIQQQYFASWRIEQTEEYSIKRSDYLVNLTRQREVPIWLFRQYNPDVDFSRLQIGQVIIFPVVEPVEERS